MITMLNFLAVMPLLSLGILPLLAHCQLFGAPNYPAGPIPSLYGIMGFGGYPSYAAPPPPFPGYGVPSYRRDAYSFPPPIAPFEYPRSPPEPYAPPLYSSPNSVVLPKLPSKYEPAVYKKSGYDKSQSYPPYKYDKSYLDSSYSAKPAHDRSTSQYKSVYPKSGINGQPYGSYREFLKTILTGQPSGVYTSAYSHSVPSVKSVLGNDYSSLGGRSSMINYEKTDTGFQPYFSGADSKSTMPMTYGEKHGYTDSRETNTKQYPDTTRYQRPPQQSYSPDAKSVLPHPALYDHKNFYQDFSGPAPEISIGHSEPKTAYQIQNSYTDKKTGYTVTYDTPSLISSSSNDRRNLISSNYDILPVYDNSGLKQNGGLLYQTSAAQPANGQETYENMDGNSYIPSKSQSISTYLLGEKQSEHRREPTASIHEKKTAPMIDDSYAGVKYPSLGYEVDRDHRKPSSAIIAALFGGAKHGKLSDAFASGEQYGRLPQKSSYDQTAKQVYYGFPASGYDEQAGSGKYRQLSTQNSHQDIFIPVGRKHPENSKRLVQWSLHTVAVFCGFS